MCTLNMTFEIPEARSIDIEALKQNIQAYVNLLVSYPTILKKETDAEKEYTERMLERFAGCWHGDETPEQILSKIKENGSFREPLSM